MSMLRASPWHLRRIIHWTNPCPDPAGVSPTIGRCDFTADPTVKWKHAVSASAVGDGQFSELGEEGRKPRDHLL